MKLNDEGRKKISDIVSSRSARKLGEAILKRITLERKIVEEGFSGSTIKNDLNDWCERVLECHRYAMTRDSLEKLLFDAEAFVASCVARNVRIPRMTRVRAALGEKILGVENTYPDRATNKGNRKPRKKRPRS